MTKQKSIFAHPNPDPTRHICFCQGVFRKYCGSSNRFAEVAQLVEHDLAPRKEWKRPWQGGFRNYCGSSSGWVEHDLAPRKEWKRPWQGGFRKYCGSSNRFAEVAIGLRK